MALFGRNKPVVFDRYGSRRRSGFPLPRWLITLLVGVAIGVGGLYFVQEEYLPPRLTPAESQRLQARVAELETERARLQAALDETTGQARGAGAEATRQIETARAENAKLSGALATARQSVERLQQDLSLFDLVLPPDPRGSTIGVRAARFANDSGQLDYHVLLTREQTRGKPFEGVMELVVAGVRPGGRNDTITLDLVPVSLGSYQHLRGKLPLPEGFEARQTTIRVLDRPDGQMLGMRVLNVR